MGALIDLSQLPPPDVVEELDFETLLGERKAALIVRYPAEEQADIAAVLALESEPLTKFLEESAFRELLLRQRINEAARAVMLAYAKGKDLEHIAALFGIQRLVIKPADPVAGTPAEMEEDADLRLRVQLAPQSFSTAGPEGAYRSLGRNADGRVLDVSATSPTEGEVRITVLSREGDGTAAPDLLEKVKAALRAEDKRPLTDYVTVQSATILHYEVSATLHLFPGPDATVVVTEARKRLATYVEACHRLGSVVVRSGLDAALHVAGVKEVELHQPADHIRPDMTQAPYCTGMTVTPGAQRA
ncbi:baseplate J/gp47 family protein [Ralstonia wenshanensis]|uniref:baseplate assembly protein n=1 Tax=Ralstonia wenshanensis TaxID=2842456 RepID=UPI001E65BB3C|nr:baseplate J/gp47 family protein [Ralstonia wenshanensis]UGS89797.1 baseplate J/gp47 family protein [Ralstonia wenshanensis]